MNNIIVGFIVAAGITLCVSGFSKKGLPLSNEKRITGRAAKVVGIISLVLSLVAACVWIALTSAVG